MCKGGLKGAAKWVEEEKKTQTAQRTRSTRKGVFCRGNLCEGRSSVRGVRTSGYLKGERGVGFRVSTQGGFEIAAVHCRLTGGANVTQTGQKVPQTSSVGREDIRKSSRNVKRSPSGDPKNPH